MNPHRFFHPYPPPSAGRFKLNVSASHVPCPSVEIQLLSSTNRGFDLSADSDPPPPTEITSCQTGALKEQNTGQNCKHPAAASAD